MSSEFLRKLFKLFGDPMRRHRAIPACPASKRLYVTQKLIALFTLISAFFSTSFAQHGFQLIEKQNEKKIEVLYDGALLTAYCFFDSTEKPILFPLKTVSGVTVTRGYPITPRAGERTDHPHHTGLWLNYESVNGLDFWNNSFAIADSLKHRYGSIKHQRILTSKADGQSAFLQTFSHWVNSKQVVLLHETTSFRFSKNKNDFIIDRTSTLTAVADEVFFKDVKDGLLGLRVARELEMPSQQKDKFVDASGNVTEVPALNNEGVTGNYKNKEGITGDQVWSKRSAWASLTGKKDGKNVYIIIIDHPSNTGYPTYWHARGYGLFAANPLGQKIFSNGKEELNLKLRKGESVQFTYRVVIHEGNELSNAAIEKLTADFIKKSI
jgi:hypothetical protein